MSVVGVCGGGEEVGVVLEVRGLVTARGHLASFPTLGLRLHLGNTSKKVARFFLISFEPRKEVSH